MPTKLRAVGLFSSDSRAQSDGRIMQIRKVNEEGLGRGRKMNSQLLKCQLIIKFAAKRKLDNRSYDDFCRLKGKYHANLMSFQNPKTFVCQQKQKITV